MMKLIYSTYLKFGGKDVTVAAREDGTIQLEGYPVKLNAANALAQADALTAASSEVTTHLQRTPKRRRGLAGMT